MTTSAPRTELEKLVKNFGLFPKQMKIMEQQRLLILELRARGGSYPQIRQLLARVGLQVSDASLSKFCCKHQPEIERMRLLLEEEGILPAPSESSRYQPPLSTASPSTQIIKSPPQKIPRDLRGPV